MSTKKPATATTATTTTTIHLPCTIRTLFLIFSLISTISLSSFLLFNKPTSIPQKTLQIPTFNIKVFVLDLPRSYNYGLIQKYWSLPGSDVENAKLEYPPLPDNLAIEQHSAEYWMLGDLMTNDKLRNNSFAKRVFDVKDADVVFVPFFSAVSAEMPFSVNNRVVKGKVERNEDLRRQKKVVDLVRNSESWKLSGGRDHVFVVSDPMAMMHVKREIAPAILLTVDFGAWPELASKRSQQSQASLLKDVIIPYNHLLPTLSLSEEKLRHNLLYFRGGKRRQREGIVRTKLWDLLVNEPGVVMEEGTATASGRNQSVIGMRTSEFCLDPAGDTPSSCRLFDAIQSLCIPVIVSDHIELPYEGMIDYSEFSIFVSVNDSLQPKWLINRLQSISKEQREEYRRNMARVQSMFVYKNAYPGGIGPIHPDGAVNQIWKKVYQKVPLIKQAVIRDRRKPPGVSIPLRCQCT